MYVDEKNFMRWDNDMYVKTTDGRRLPLKCPRCGAYIGIDNKIGFAARCENGHFYGVVDNPINSNRTAFIEWLYADK